ncbi:MAG: C4-dicarboxylate ABC transporter substrate-binding protein [Alphaproteobacteria bacterium]|nr:MAG: C4-dicarboxylate ABC transporter substrate-binding protein [Alphaproteobacteria bacterium]
MNRLRALAVSLLAAALLAGCARSRDVVVIKLAHGLDQGHPVHKAMAFFGERLAEKSGGTLRVDLYSGGQLGTERECLELLQMGGLGMTKVSSSVLEGFVPAYRVFGLPYLFRDEAHRWAVLEGPIGHEILEAAEPVFLRGLCYYDAGTRSFYTTRKAVRTPADLAGLKIRVQESPMAIAMVRSLGGSATPIAWGELYTALQQGVVDGAENNPPSFHLSRHYELCRYYALDEHTAVPDVFVISLHLWRRLTPEQRAWVQAAADESAVYQRSLWAQATAEALAVVAAAGVEIIHPDKAAFNAQVRALHEDVRRTQPLVGDLARRIAEVQP